MSRPDDADKTDMARHQSTKPTPDRRRARDRGADRRRARPSSDDAEGPRRPPAEPAGAGDGGPPEDKDCKLCGGSGWLVTRGDTDEASRCICYGRATGEFLIEAARIPARFAHATLENLRTYGNRELQDAIRRAAAFADTFPEAREGLLITGPPGIGKTHIAVGVLKRVIRETHARGLYYDTRDLLRSIRTTYDPAAGPHEIDVVDPVIKTDLLILDDLGAERATSWVDDMMTTIINTRYNERRPIIATSNYENSSNGYRKGSPTGPGNGNGAADRGRRLSQRLGKATFSRLREMCDFIEYEGLDYREFAVGADDEDLKAAWRDTQRLRHRQRVRS